MDAAGSTGGLGAVSSRVIMKAWTRGRTQRHHEGANTGKDAASSWRREHGEGRSVILRRERAEGPLYAEEEPCSPRRIGVLRRCAPQDDASSLFVFAFRLRLRLLLPSFAFRRSLSPFAVRFRLSLFLHPCPRPRVPAPPRPRAPACLRVTYSTAASRRRCARTRSTGPGARADRPPFRMPPRPPSCSTACTCP